MQNKILHVLLRQNRRLWKPRETFQVITSEIHVKVLFSHEFHMMNLRDIHMENTIWNSYEMKWVGVSFARGDFACASDINKTCSRRNNSKNSRNGGGEQNSIVSGADYQYGVALPLIWHNSLHCLSATWRPPVNRPLTSVYQRHLFLFRC